MQSITVLYIDFSLTGHHLPYLKTILDNAPKEEHIILILPKKTEVFSRFLVFEAGVFVHRNLRSYLHWVRKIKEVVRKTKPDIIHFLSGDELYPMFGFGLSFLKKLHCIITFHRINESFLGLFSIKRLFKKINYGVVLTNYLFEKLRSKAINNIKVVPYPACLGGERIEKNAARKRLGLSLDKKVFLLIGATSFYKGLDIFLESSRFFRSELDVLIAGQFTDFSENFVKEYTNTFNGNLYCINRLLTDEDFCLSVCAADYLVLPYRKRFNGISGPMIESAWLETPIIGPNCNSIGLEIKKFQIGISFEAENREDLGRVINAVCSKNLDFEDSLKKYKKLIDPKRLNSNYLKIYVEVLKR